MELLLGAGSNREKKIWMPEKGPEWRALVTVDMNAEHDPDIVFDLAEWDWAFGGDNSFDEIHAYDVMEHLGMQGDYETFFQQWSEIWRMLKPDGYFCGISPGPNSPWLWGDPGHTRAITPQCLYFLTQPNYDEVGRTPMTDYRFCYYADFNPVHMEIKDDQFFYVLQAVKPSRIKT